jgi:diacylglycerol kinase
LVFSFALILLSELFNTALEIILERLHPERHDLIGAGKDIASAVVFAALLFAFFVCGMTFLRYFGFIELR